MDKTADVALLRTATSATFAGEALNVRRPGIMVRIGAQLSTLLVIILVIPASYCSAQGPGPASPDRDNGWLSIAVGRGAPYDLSGVISANFGRDYFWQVAYSGVGNLSLGGEVPVVSAIGLSRGFSLVDRIGRVALSAGPAVSWGKQPPRDIERRLSRFVTVAAVIDLQLVFSPIKEIGIGIDLLTNLNTTRSVAGIGFLLIVEGNK